MKQFAVIAAAEPRARTLAEMAVAIGSREQWPPPTTLSITAGSRTCEVVVWGEEDGDVLDTEREQAAVLFSSGAYGHDGRRISAAAMLDSGGEPSLARLAGMAAPQAVLLACGRRSWACAATDQIGLAAVYYASRDDGVAVGSSSRLVAAILGCELDQEAIGAYALLGAFAATDTPFLRVRRLGAGECARLDQSGLVIEQYCPTAARTSDARHLSGEVPRGVAAVRAGVEACIAAHPEAAIELSGGLDSRLILAALLAAGKKPIQALTLGEASDPDVAIAASLAQRAGIGHTRVDLGGIAGLDPDAALGTVDAAGRRRDYSDNCVSLGVLDWVEASFGAAPRFSGQNGELARGFYYPLQPPWPTTSNALARALVRWRLIANERASSELLEAGVWDAGVRHATATAQSFFERAGGDWLTATDLLYLYWRMQRWVGSDWSASSQTRVVLAPFFNPAFVTWALNARPGLKRNSRLLARVLDAIDPELARIPLADGKPPTSMFAPTISDRTAAWSKTAHKVAVKVRQRVKESAKPPAGADALSRLTLAGMRNRPAALERVAALPFVCSEYVERIADGAPASPPTVGLLVGLSGLAGDLSVRAALVPRRLATVGD